MGRGDKYLFNARSLMTEMHHLYVGVTGLYWSYIYNASAWLSNVSCQLTGWIKVDCNSTRHQQQYFYCINWTWTWSQCSSDSLTVCRTGCAGWWAAARWWQLLPRWGLCCTFYSRGDPQWQQDKQGTSILRWLITLSLALKKIYYFSWF